MTLGDITPASTVFIDANVFIYHFLGQSRDCSALLDRVEARDVRGCTGRTTLLEVAHRLMILEAIEQGLGAGANPAARLARKPDLVRRLSKYHFAVMKISQIGIEDLHLPPDFMTKSQEYRQTYGLLVNDSLVPLYMHEAGVPVLASADPAFDRIPWIRRAAPSDV
ncbi:MAG: type II toxin-antitoxin system VapC family toxin [bacterium]